MGWAFDTNSKFFDDSADTLHPRFAGMLVATPELNAQALIDMANLRAARVPPSDWKVTGTGAKVDPFRVVELSAQEKSDRSAVELAAVKTQGANAIREGLDGYLTNRGYGNGRLGTLYGLLADARAGVADTSRIAKISPVRSWHKGILDYVQGRVDAVAAAGSVDDVKAVLLATDFSTFDNVDPKVSVEDAGATAVRASVITATLELEAAVAKPLADKVK